MKCPMCQRQIKLNKNKFSRHYGVNTPLSIEKYWNKKNNNLKCFGSNMNSDISSEVANEMFIKYKKFFIELHENKIKQEINSLYISHIKKLIEKEKESLNQKEGK